MVLLCECRHRILACQFQIAVGPGCLGHIRIGRREAAIFRFLSKVTSRVTPEEYLLTRGCAAFAENWDLDWLSLLQTATWFSDIVKVRDHIVHYGGHTMVLDGPSEGILFQVHGRSYQNLVNVAPLMFNQNVVYFERYAAHLMSHLVVFLEAFASIVYLRLGRSRNPDDTARNCSPGWGTLGSWIDSTLAAVESLGH